MSEAKKEYYKWHKTTIPINDKVCSNYVTELEQQNKELIEALNSACLNCHRFCDEECHAYFIKHKFTIGGER